MNVKRGKKENRMGVKNRGYESNQEKSRIPEKGTEVEREETEKWEEKAEKHSLPRYLNDIRTIKGLLEGIEKKPLYEHWVFYTWGGVIILGTLIHYSVERTFHLAPLEIFLKVWLPCILVGSFLESIAFVRNMLKHSLTIYSKDMIRLFLGMFGFFLIVGFLVVLLVRLDALQYLAIILILSCAMFFFLLGQNSFYTYLFIHGFLMIILAIILFIFDIEHDLLTVIAGLAIGVSFIITGIWTGRIKIESGRNSKYESG